MKVSVEIMSEIEQHARRYDSANCWTGTSETLSVVIIDLFNYIKEIE